MMKRIILHHTGGTGRANSVDKKHYHRIINDDGSVISGKHSISNNAPGASFKSGTYAAHTKNLNTASIGLSIAAMANADWANPKETTSAFPTELQMNALIKEAALLAQLYGIPVSRRTILSHAEVQITLGVAQAGKWDFDYDPFGELSSRDPLVIGDMLRRLIQIEVNRLDGRVEPVLSTEITRPILRRGSVGDDVAILQKILGLTTDRIFGPKTETAVVAFQKRKQLLPDGIVGPITWAALMRSE